MARLQTVSLPEELYAQLRDYAHQRRLPISQVVADALRAHLPKPAKTKEKK